MDKVKIEIRRTTVGRPVAYITHHSIIIMKRTTDDGVRDPFLSFFLVNCQQIVNKSSLGEPEPEQ